MPFSFIILPLKVPTSRCTLHIHVELLIIKYYIIFMVTKTLHLGTVNRIRCDAFFFMENIYCIFIL